jgi:peptidoglycan hydrolase CwlO-like protein
MERTTQDKVTFSAKKGAFIFTESSTSTMDAAEFKKLYENVQENVEKMKEDLKNLLDEGIEKLEDSLKKQQEACEALKQKIEIVKESIPFKEMQIKDREKLLAGAAKEYKLACDITTSKEAPVMNDGKENGQAS